MNIKSLLELETRIDYFSQFSFDIFDTLVFRIVEDHSEREIDISKLSSDYLNSQGIKCLYQDYMVLREIEFQKSKNITLDEVDYFSSLYNILDELLVPLDKRDYIVNKLWMIEEEYEISVAYANPEAEKILPILKKYGKEIIAISDMYLPKSSIKAILSKVGLLTYFNDIYVSSDHCLTKHSGTIYKYLLDIGCLKKGNVLHVGDNWISDEVMSANNLVFGLHYVNQKNEKRKSKLAISRWKKHKFSLLKNTEDLSDLLSKAFAVYIRDIFSYAIRNKSKRVYFFTRDANFLLSSAEVYKERFKIHDVELKTLHLDRMNSFFLNIRTLSDLEKHLWLFGDSNSLTFNNFLNKIGYLDICLKKYKNIIEENKEISLRMALVTNQLKEIIFDCITMKNKAVIEYLTKEGVLSKDNSILVDIGYSGTSMREINYFIRDNGLEKQQGRLDCILFASNRFFNANAVSFSAPVYLHLVKIFPFHRVNPLASMNHSWLEPFVLDTRMGPLERYDESTLKPIRREYDILPIYEDINLNKKINSWFDKNLELLDLTELQKKLEYTVIMPSKSQVRKYEHFTHVKGFDNSIKQPLLKKVSLSNMKKDILTLVRDDYWIGASLAKSNLSFLVRIACNYMFYVRKFFGV